MFVTLCGKTILLDSNDPYLGTNGSNDEVSINDFNK